ncbi:hypothetical protein DSM104299_04185 [Baekduia alba]|uniref:hypothetical protein n=1 Tax=Baekduia alba TaxID=2997333 RepID=UPI00233FCF84|nr:hypothetical protein [Baekduia alba]WCB95441.1 hypothetical protein DSM104299_04185 [Baekduia alba]
MRVPSLAGVFRFVGLAVTLAGCVLVVASLSETWAEQDSSRDVVATRTGWDWLGIGDVLLLGVCALTAVLAVALCVGPRSRKVSRSAGGLALTLLVLALVGVGVTYWLVDMDFAFWIDSDDADNYSAGPGYQAAAVGLGIAVLGLLILLAGRWEARTRKALRREAAAAAVGAAADPGEPEPSWAAR